VKDNISLEKRRAFLGCVERREQWSLTWRGRLILSLAVVLVAVFTVRGVHSFLSLHQPVESSVLVIEGWIPRYALTGFVAQCSNYSHIYTTGGPTLGDLDSADVSDTHASVARSRLLRAGVPQDKVHMVPAKHLGRDRSYTSALTLREWARTNGVTLTSFNVVTMGPHARRSRLLYRKAFGDHVKIGVISLEDQQYDSRHWWRYSEGIRNVISESAAYLYVRVFFDPED
jgi:uncharacterized SAM-binding protein YcdF (DUF218 family)